MLSQTKTETIADDEQIYHRNGEHTYILRYAPYNESDAALWQLQEYTLDADGEGSHNNKVRSSRRREDNRTFVEFMPKARFKSQRNLRRYESRVLGRPEMLCIVAVNNSNRWEVRPGTTGWWDGNMKQLNLRFGPWSEFAGSSDYYTVEWIEEDGGDNIPITLGFRFRNIYGSIAFTIQSKDDHIGKASIHYFAPVPHGGFRYDLGGFEFWIAHERD